jgi:hypothetical protein
LGFKNTNRITKSPPNGENRILKPHFSTPPTAGDYVILTAFGILKCLHETIIS